MKTNKYILLDLISCLNFKHYFPLTSEHLHFNVLDVSETSRASKWAPDSLPKQMLQNLKPYSSECYPHSWNVWFPFPIFKKNCTGVLDLTVRPFCILYSLDTGCPVKKMWPKVLLFSSVEQTQLWAVSHIIVTSWHNECLHPRRDGFMIHITASTTNTIQSNWKICAIKKVNFTISTWYWCHI